MKTWHNGIVMKKPWYLFTVILAITVIGCNGQSGKVNNMEKPELTLSQKETPGSAATAINQIPIPITRTDFLKLVMDYEKNTETWVYRGEKPCLIDFYADWCGPCHIASPILDELAKKYAGKINIYKVDIDKEQELASVFGVQSIPSFLFCPMEGTPTISSGIASTPDATRKMFIQQIDELLLKKGKSPTL